MRERSGQQEKRRMRNQGGGKMKQQAEPKPEAEAREGFSDLEMQERKRVSLGSTAEKKGRNERRGKDQGRGV